MKINEFSFTDHFNVGDKVYGFCNGFFGRDDYEDKIVEIITKDYVVFRYADETGLNDEDGYLEVTEHAILDITAVISYDRETGLSSIRLSVVEDFKEWKNKEN